MRRDFVYNSKDGQTKIHALEWIPEGEVKGVIQILHGMVEYIGRYDRFAGFMAEQGFYVVGNDHLGHGASVISEADHGFFAQPDGNACVIGDIRNLHRYTMRKYPHVPYIMLGHSMGSFLARQYITRFGHDLSGVIIMGTGYQSDALLKMAKTIAGGLGKTAGWTYESNLLEKMVLGSYNKAFAPARTPYDWLTKDESIVDAYALNPWNTFRFTTNAYYHMFLGMEKAQKKEALAKIPPELPMLILSGAKDPVGDMGKGVQKVYDLYTALGLEDVQMKLYEDDRHEILNELDYMDVQKDILQWIQALDAFRERPSEDCAQKKD